MKRFVHSKGSHSKLWATKNRKTKSHFDPFDCAQGRQAQNDFAMERIF